MKKFTTIPTALALALSSLTAGAVNYVVWSGDDLKEGETQIPTKWEEWWGMSFAATDDINSAEGKAMKFTCTTSGTCSMGIYQSSDEFDNKVLSDLDLVFTAKAEGSADYSVRLTATNAAGDKLSPENDATFTVASDGQYHEIRLNIKSDFPDVYNLWQSNPKGYVFSLIADNKADAVLYLYDIHYEAAIEMPAITAEVSNVTTTSADIVYAVTFPDGYTNTSVTVNDEPAETSATLNLAGLSPKTKYTYTIVAKGELDGKEYSTEKVVTFTTAREEGDNPVWYGETDIEGFHAIYNITWNPDKTLTVNTTLETENETPAGDRNFHIYINGNEWLKLYDEDEDGILSGTTTSTFEEGTVITWEWYMPYAGGVYQQTNQYTVGSENEPIVIVPAPRISASSQNVTYNSAEIAYELTIPDELKEAEVKVFYQAAGGEALVAEASPIALTGLEENTQYTYDVYAVATLGEETFESKHVEVSFKTPRENAVDLVYADYTKAEFKNAWLVGENPDTDRRTMYFSFPWSVTYKTDGTALYQVDLSQAADVVGLNPQIWSGDFRQLTKNEETGLYEYNFGQQTEGATVEISHYFAYDGGQYDFRTPYVTFGQEQEAPTLGEAANLTLTASKENVMVNENVVISAVATDAAGYYLPVTEVEYQIPDGVERDGIHVKLTQKGSYTITATANELSASVTLTAIASEDAENVAAGVIGTTDEEYVIENTKAENATDGDESTELRWGCGETEEHYLILDLTGSNPNGYYIEAVDVLFEGAYASEFSVTLSNTNPLSAISSQADDAEDVVFTNTEATTHHIFTQQPTAMHKYVTLRTTKALNTGWGIKLKEIRVYGTTTQASSSDDINAESASATEQSAEGIYDLNGNRVYVTVPGQIYIIDGKKVLVK